MQVQLRENLLCIKQQVILFVNYLSTADIPVAIAGERVMQCIKNYQTYRKGTKPPGEVKIELLWFLFFKDKLLKQSFNQYIMQYMRRAPKSQRFTFKYMLSLLFYFGQFFFYFSVTRCLYLRKWHDYNMRWHIQYRVQETVFIIISIILNS